MSCGETAEGSVYMYGLHGTCKRHIFSLFFCGLRDDAVLQWHHRTTKPETRGLRGELCREGFYVLKAAFWNTNVFNAVANYDVVFINY